MPATAAEIRNELHALANPAIAEHSQRFFKTGKGEYGEGDRFLGIRVPVVRKAVRQNRDATLRTIAALLRSPWHEVRLFALIALSERYKSSEEVGKRQVFDTYMKNLDRVNNWDLVDCSAHLIVGPWLESRSRAPLYRLARSKDLWQRRIAIMSTYHYIRAGEFEDTFAIADMLLNDEQDLIHKAVGWMLREVGNRDRAAEERFLRTRYPSMPRTMLRYAIERLPEPRRKAYLAGRV